MLVLYICTDKRDETNSRASLCSYHNQGSKLSLKKKPTLAPHLTKYARCGFIQLQKPLLNIADFHKLFQLGQLQNTSHIALLLLLYTAHLTIYAICTIYRSACWHLVKCITTFRPHLFTTVIKNKHFLRHNC